MDRQTLARYMIQFAKREVSGGKGRIFLPEFLATLPEKVEPLKMLEAWRQNYDEPISWVTDNVMIVEFESPHVRIQTPDFAKEDNKKLVKEKVV